MAWVFHFNEAKFKKIVPTIILDLEKHLGHVEYYHSTPILDLEDKIVDIHKTNFKFFAKEFTINEFRYVIINVMRKHGFRYIITSKLKDRLIFKYQGFKLNF